jgi:hypothetical protein
MRMWLTWRLACCQPLFLLQVVVPMLPAALGGNRGSSSKGSSDGPASGGSSEEEHHVVLVGSVPALGCWDVGLGLRLARDDAGMWKGTVELPMGYPISAKVGACIGCVRTWSRRGAHLHTIPDLQCLIYFYCVHVG